MAITSSILLQMTWNCHQSIQNLM